MGQDLEVVHSLARDTEPGGVRQGHAAEAGEGGHPISEGRGNSVKQRNVVNQSIRTFSRIRLISKGAHRRVQTLTPRLVWG